MELEEELTYFNTRNGIFYIEDIAVSDIAEQIATPFYGYSRAAIEQNYKTLAKVLRTALPVRPPLIAYALKANSNIAVLRLLSELGAGADIVSEGELRRALKAGIRAEKIVFSGVGKTIDEIDFALGQNILCFNVESLAELSQIAARAQAIGRNAPISLRINPDIDAGSHAKITTGRAQDKFGIPYHQAGELYQQASLMKGIEIKGIDTHIGSQICNLAPFDKAFAVMAQLAQYLRSQGHAIKHVDIGGGLGIDYGDGTPALPLADYGQLIKRHFSALDLEVICEPGRMIVGNAGLLITSTIYFKTTATKNFIIVDAAMNDLVRPTLYDAHHKIIAVSRPSKPSHPILVDIVGPVCESGDYLAKDIWLAPPSPGDLLAVMSAGAYGAVMASSYNSRPLIPEILVAGNQFDVVRRRPSFEEMLALEIA